MSQHISVNNSNHEIKELLKLLNYMNNCRIHFCILSIFTYCEQKHVAYGFYFQPVAVLSSVELVENQTNGLIQTCLKSIKVLDSCLAGLSWSNITNQEVRGKRNI